MRMNRKNIMFIGTSIMYLCTGVLIFFLFTGNENSLLALIVASIVFITAGVTGFKTDTILIRRKIEYDHYSVFGRVLNIVYIIIGVSLIVFVFRSLFS